MNNKERLSRLIAQYQKNMEFYRNAREFNEQDCRDEFISPLLESFGWDVHNEKGTSPQELKKMLALYNIVIEQAITIGCDRITILKRKENIQPAFQNKYCSMQIIDDMYLLVCLHLPSKLYAGVLKRGIVA